jgi:flagellar export protein FliJ
MSKPGFRLAAVLRLREAARDEHRADMAEAQQADAELANQQRELARQIRENRQQLRTIAQPGDVDMGTLQAQHRHQLLLAEQEQSLRRRREQTQREIEERREELLAADQQVKAVEKLRQRGRDRLEHALRRNETKQLDEIAARCGLQGSV